MTIDLHVPPQRTASSAGGSLRADVVTRRTDLTGLRDAWDRLRARCGRFWPDADPDRYAVVLEALDASPHVVVLRDHRGPCGLLAARYRIRRPRLGVGYAAIAGPALRTLEVIHDGCLLNGRPDVAGWLVAHLRSLLVKRRWRARLAGRQEGRLREDVDV